jgi:tetratricopeptide (TPR) repeat protein
MAKQLPERPRSHVLEELSLQHLKATLPAAWICRRVEDDYGLDVRVEIVAGGQVTAVEFSVQLKATDDLKTSGGHVLHRCKTSTARYFLRRPEPVMYVVYDAQEQAAYWLWVQPYLEGLDETDPGWREQKTLQIRVPRANRLTTKSAPVIANHVQAWWARVLPAVGWEYAPSPQEARPPFTLPPDLPTFTGRDDLLGTLDGLLHPGGQTAVAIVGLKGMAGVGKSVLAVHAAYRWRDRFPDGVVWVDLRESSACDGLRHVAALYGYQEEAARLGDDPQALSALVRTVLQGKRALLVLDNAEGLPEGDLACLLPGAQGPVTVVTSRHAFPALARLGQTLRVDVMSEGEALDLLGELVGEEEVEAQRGAYDDLAKRLGRLPLALDVAGRRMSDRGWGPGEMVRRLEGAADLPAFLALPTAEKPEDSVALAFALSYDALDEGDQALFRALSPFAPVGFTPAAVAAVLERDDVYGVEAALERLEALSLARRMEAAGRYDLHPLLRDYARALAGGQAGEGERWGERHARYFLALAGWGRDQLGDPETALQAVQMAALERANLLAAQEACLSQGLWGEAVSLAYRLNSLLERSGHWADRRGALEAGIEAALEGGDENSAAELSHNLGVACRDIGEYGEARALYQQALQFKRQQEDQAGVAVELHELGRLAQDQGNYARARRLYQESLDIEQQLGDRAGVASTLHGLGNVAYLQGDYAEARRLYQEAAGTFEQLGAQREQAAVLYQLGMLAQAQGDYAEARRLYQEVAGTFEQLGARREQATVLHQLGMLAQLQWDYAEARRLYQESLDIKQQLGYRAGVASTLHQLGMLAQDQGDYAEARRLYQKSLDIEQQLGYRAGVASTLHQLGRLAQDQGDYAEARRLYQESLDIAQQLGDRASAGATLAQLALLEEAEGNAKRALELIRQAEAIFTELGSPYAAQARRDRERLEGKRQ